MDIQYLPDGKFYRNIFLILTDNLDYKPSMSVDQFFSDGFAERKLIMILDIYDLVNKVNKSMKIAEHLTAVTDGPYASDIPTHVYEVINHRKGEATKFQFVMNPTLQKSKVTVLQKTDIPKQVIQKHRFNEAQYQKVMNDASMQSSVYSLRRRGEGETKKCYKSRKVIEPI